MTIERKIEEALMRHAEDVEAEPGAWNRIESRVRRGYRIRIAVFSAAAAAAAAAAVIVVPKIVGSNGGDRVVPPASQAPSTGPTEYSSGILPPDWTYALNPAHGYFFAHPNGWRSGVFEGHYEYRPPGLPAMAVGEDTFVFQTYQADDSLPRPEGPSTTTEVGGREARRWEETQSGGSHSVTYEVAWDCWAGPGVVVDCQTPRLIVNLFASTPDLWNMYGQIGERMVVHLSHASGTTPSGDIKTTHGLVKAGVRPFDDRTWALIRLFEATIMADTDTVSDILTTEARRQLRQATGRGARYYEPGGDYVLLGYKIVSRADADANSSNFVVHLTESKSPDGPDQELAAEWGVGPGRSVSGRQERAVVRFVNPQVD